jgi:hypothetical protein
MCPLSLCVDSDTDESEAMSDQSRQQLFDEWFAGAYDEPDREAAA